MRSAPEIVDAPTRVPVPGPVDEQTRQSELMVACAAGKLAVVRRLLAAGADPNTINGFGETPLTYAVAAQRESVTLHLLAKGANVELPLGPAWGPLLYAAATGNHRILTALLDKGADVTRRDQEGRAAIDIAKKAGHFRAAALLNLRTALAATVRSIRRSEPNGRSKTRARKPGYLRHRTRTAVRPLPVQ